MNIFALWGEIEINRRKAETDIVAVEKQAEKSGKKMEGAFGKVTKVVGTVLNEVQQLDKRLETAGKALTSKFGLQFGALTALMGGLAKATSNYTAAVKDNAAIVGLSTESYQELQYAMAQSGLEQGEFIRMMGRVNQRIGFARQGNEKYRKSLQNLGISLEDVDKGLVGTEETFLAMINHLHEMDDAQKQAALAGDFFGVMLSRRMMPLIKDGVQSVEELRQRAHELGLVMDDLAVAKGDLLSDTLDDLSFTAKGLGRIFGSEMHAPMINISRAVTDVIAGISEWLTENPKIVRQIVMWGGAIAGVLGVLVTLGTTLVITGKIIGALGTVFNILTSKPLLIIAAIGALYLAWKSDWLGIRTAVEEAWGVIEPKLEAIIEWGNKTISTVWNWTTNTVSAFLSWVQETAWPWIGDTVSTTWDWAKGTVADFIEWVQGTASPWIGGVASTAWDWTEGTVADFITWIKDVAAPWFGETVSTVWNWTLDVGGRWFDAIKKGFDTGDWSDFWDITEDLWSTGVVLAITLSSAVQGISAVIGAIQSGLGLVAATGASLGIPGLVGALSVGIQLMEAQAEGSYEDFAKNVIAAGLIAAFLYPVLGPGGALAGFNLVLNLKLGEDAFDGFEVLFGWIGHNLESLFSGRWDEFLSLDDYIEQQAQEKALDLIMEDYPENLKKAIEWLRDDIPENLWEERTEMAARIWDVDENEIRAALGLDLIGEAIAEARTLQDVLDAIYRAEGGATAKIPYGMTSFADGEVSYSRAKDNERFAELSAGTAHGSEEYWRAAAQTTVEMWWDHFTELFPSLAGQHFDEVSSDVQQLFLVYLGKWFAPPDASELNLNWIPNVSKMLGFDEMSETFRGDFWNTFQTLVDVIYEMADGDIAKATEYMAQVIADYLVGQSPPPEGPLSDIDEGGQRVMEAWVEGAEKGIKDGVPALTSGLEKVKGLFTSIWDKVPEEIKGPIEQAMAWITDLIGQAEEALFKLDEFQEELDVLMGGGASPEEQAQGFMARLAAGLSEKLDELDEPMNRLVDAVYTAGATLFEFGKTIASGNWLDALLVILMETESFAKAMELLGKVMKPIVALFDIILRPIVEGLLKLWNGIIDALASISIFGWKPFEGLTQHKVSWDDDAGGGSGGRDGGTGGRQVSEITGPTRDLLVDLLSPLANFGQIVAPIQDIRNILYERLPNFESFGMDFAGAGAIGGDIVFESGAIVINSSGTSATELSRDMRDAIEREMARRVNFGIRGRGGR